MRSPPSNEFLLKEYHHLLSKIIDVHNHLQQTKNLSQLGEKIQNLAIRQCFVMGTTLSDWPTVHQISLNQSKVLPCYGCHPWFAHEWNESQILTELRSKSNSKFILGEIGLDKIAKDRRSNQKFPFESQLSLFVAQFKFGIQEKLPMSLHLVKAFPDFLGICQEFIQEWSDLYSLTRKTKLPFDLPNIMLHSYSGNQLNTN